MDDLNCLLPAFWLSLAMYKLCVLFNHLGFDLLVDLATVSRSKFSGLCPCSLKQ